jgi:hypothetical protein
MNTKKHLRKFGTLSLTLVLSTSSGLAINTSFAEAKPPSHAPAWGYRCKQEQRTDRYNKFDCEEKRGQRRRDDDRDEERNDRYESEVRRDRLTAGTVLPVEYSGSERIVLRRDERYPLTLTITRDLRDNRNSVIIPSGSRVEGEFRSVRNGVQFVARRLVLRNGETYRINATSRIIYSDRDFDDEDLRNTRISDAARIIIDSVLGNGRSTRGDSNLIVMYPDRDLDLTLNSDLQLG